jgi:hypothetical protein
MTGAGAVAAGATVLVPDALAAGQPATDDTVTYDKHPHAKGELIVVYLHNDSSSSLVINAGEHESTVSDKALANKLRKYAEWSK